MANTTNLNLVKPAGTDKALVSVINSNSEKIDAFAGAISSKATVSAIRCDNIDLNTLTKPGVYACNNCTNAPGTGWFNVEVLPIGGSGDGNENYAIQRATQISSNNIYQRADNNGTWGSWEQLALNSKISRYVDVAITLNAYAGNNNYNIPSWSSEYRILSATFIYSNDLYYAVFEDNRDLTLSIREDGTLTVMQSGGPWSGSRTVTVRVHYA